MNASRRPPPDIEAPSRARQFGRDAEPPPGVPPAFWRGLIVGLVITGAFYFLLYLVLTS